MSTKQKVDRFISGARQTYNSGLQKQKASAAARKARKPIGHRDYLIDLIERLAKSGGGIKKGLADYLCRQVRKDSLNSGEAKKIRKAFTHDGAISRERLLLIKNLVGSPSTTKKAKRVLAKMVVDHKKAACGAATEVAEAVEQTWIDLLLDADNFPKHGVVFTHSDGKADKDFRYTHFKYRVVAELVKDGYIDLFTYTKKDNDVVQPRGVYKSGSEKLCVNVNEGQMTRQMHAVFVHEATHAVQDIYNMRGTTLQREVAAHLMQAIYLRKHKQALTGRLAAEPYKRIAEEAIKKGGYDIDEDEQDDLEDALKGSYSSSSKIRDNNRKDNREDTRRRRRAIRGIRSR